VSWPPVSLSRLFQGGYSLERIEEILRGVIWRTPPFLLYYDRFYITSHNFDAPAVCTHRLKSLRTRIAGTADLPALKRFQDRGEEYAARFRKGDRAVVAEWNDEMVGMLWIEFGREHYEERDEYRFPLPDGSAWTFDAYVAPAYRGKGVLPSMEDEVACDLRQRSFHTTYSVVKIWNRTSINAQIRIGYRITRHVIFIRFLFLRIYLEKNLDQTAKNNSWQAAFAFRKLRWYRGSLQNG
jgi:GNAT superfamily N-acetyltransferase